MKIAIPVEENRGWDSPICEHFGHAPYFAFVDTDTDTVEVVANPLMEHGPGDMPQWIASQNCHILVVRGIGSRAIQYFNQFGIQVYRGASGTVRDIVNAIKSGNIADIPYEVQEKFHKHE